MPGHCLLPNELLQGGEECGCRAIVFHKKAAPDGLIGKTCIVWQKGMKRGGWLLNMVRWSVWCEIYCGGKRRCGSLCSQGTPAAHFGGISKGWNRTDRLSGWIEREREGRMIKRARQVVAPLLGMCLIQLTRHTPIHFTIEARCRSIEICYGATG